MWGWILIVTLTTSETKLWTAYEEAPQWANPPSPNVGQYAISLAGVPY